MEIEFIEVTDNDSHHYIIPYLMVNDWNDWLEIPEDDERGWEVPAWAERVDGGRPIFKSWRIG